MILLNLFDLIFSWAVFIILMFPIIVYGLLMIFKTEIFDDMDGPFGF